jgi:crotonobetainyl-CoA:carnitine CoA-transferase CaiB-like acyl-CoA transferase
MPQGALSNLKVVDLTEHIAGPFCTKLMAGFGADVIKVEKPGAGDGLRQVGPYYRNEVGPENSIPFLWLNTGKRSIATRLNTDGGREIVARLIRNADVLIEGFGPGVMAGLGLSFDVVRKLNPRIVMTSISNFGQTGPYKDYQADQITEYAMSGSMKLTGEAGRAPLSSGPAITQYSAGINAYFATMLAVFNRNSTGAGDYIDLSIQESGLDNVEIALAEHLLGGRVGNRNGDRHLLVPWQLYPCADGFAAVIGGPVRNWLDAASLFEEPRLLQPELHHMADRIKHREEVEEYLRPWLAAHGQKEIAEAGRTHGLAFGYLATAEDVLESPQHGHRGFFSEIDHPVTGRQRYCGSPFRSSETPWRSCRAPLVGEHTEEILIDGLGYSKEDVLRLRSQEAT